MAYHDDEKVLKGANNVGAKSPPKQLDLGGLSPIDALDPIKISEIYKDIKVGK